MFLHKILALAVGLSFPLGSIAAAGPEFTVEQLVQKNLEARGGLEKIKAIRTLKATGRFQQGSFSAQVSEERRAPDMIRETFTIQGMARIQAYDGRVAWRISPFEGRKTAERIGEDAAKGLIDQADFYGPLIDSKKKGIELEYLGHADVDGDDALRLRAKLKDGDILTYYFDPDTFMEIRIETQIWIRGTMRESVTDLGSYKKVNGVYFPFEIETHSKRHGDESAKITYEKIKANLNLPDSEFEMPKSAAPASKEK